MSAKKTLLSIIAGSMLAISTPSCTKTSSYDFNREIVKEEVMFKKAIRTPGFIKSRTKYLGMPKTSQVYGNVLTVKREDGSVIQYVDNKKNDHKLDLVRIMDKHGEIKEYNSSQNWTRPIFREAQNQYDTYKENILRIKTTEGLSLVK
ncbi:hypothetical protein KO361_01305 [Candidatus Woesearchaeota archaeon]|nr:hypothetical protein [Candidatus Woesearchaeota archaeon]